MHAETQAHAHSRIHTHHHVQISAHLHTCVRPLTTRYRIHISNAHCVKGPFIYSWHDVIAVMDPKKLARYIRNTYCKTNISIDNMSNELNLI